MNLIVLLWPKCVTYWFLGIFNDSQSLDLVVIIMIHLSKYCKYYLVRLLFQVSIRVFVILRHSVFCNLSRDFETFGISQEFESLREPVLFIFDDSSKRAESLIRNEVN